MTQKHFTHRTNNTCCTQIDVWLEGEIVHQVEFQGGCRGNHEGLKRLIVGRRAAEVAATLRGTPCKGNTSCPDQLAAALEAAMKPA